MQGLYLGLPPEAKSSNALLLHELCIWVVTYYPLSSRERASMETAEYCSEDHHQVEGGAGFHGQVPCFIEGSFVHLFALRAGLKQR